MKSKNVKFSFVMEIIILPADEHLLAVAELTEIAIRFK